MICVVLTSWVLQGSKLSEPFSSWLCKRAFTPNLCNVLNGSSLGSSCKGETNPYESSALEGCIMNCFLHFMSISLCMREQDSLTNWTGASIETKCSCALWQWRELTHVLLTCPANLYLEALKTIKFKVVSGILHGSHLSRGIAHFIVLIEIATLGLTLHSQWHRGHHLCCH